MPRYEGRRSAGGSRPRKRGRLGLLIVAVLALAVIAAVIVFIVRQGGLAGTEDPAAADTQTTETTDADSETSADAEETDDGITFPYQETESGLEIRGLFTSTITNPDGGGELVENLASLEVANTTGQYLLEAEISVLLADDTTCTFTLYDLPADGTAMIFSPENATYDSAVSCMSITATATFAEGDQLLSDQVTCTVEGTEITLTNTSEEDLGALTVVCHDTLDSSAFGGIAYSYPVESLPAGESVTVTAADCTLGQATVVRISEDG